MTDEQKKQNRIKGGKISGQMNIELQRGIGADLAGYGRKVGLANKGRRWITDGKTNKRWSPINVMPDGFFLGRTMPWK